MDNPIAMPYPYGWIRDQESNNDKWGSLRKELDNLYKEGAEDPGDTLSRQVGGTHYKKGIQPWTIALDWGLDPWSHNVVKYILRFPYKNGKEDLEKIAHYVEFLLENYDEVHTKYYK